METKVLRSPSEMIPTDSTLVCFMLSRQFFANILEGFELMINASIEDTGGAAMNVFIIVTASNLNTRTKSQLLGTNLREF